MNAPRPHRIMSGITGVGLMLVVVAQTLGAQTITEIIDAAGDV